MRIWIDGYEANVEQRLGSSQVAFNLLKALEKLDHQNDYRILLPNQPLDDLPKERLGWRYQIIKPSYLKTWLALPWALFTSSEKPDIFFSPTHYGPIISPVKRIITIFDLAYLRFPQMFKQKDFWQMKLMTKFSVQSSKHIITISKASMEDIIKYYQIDKSKITVTYPGFDKNIFHPAHDKQQTLKILNKYQISGDYVIYVGTIQPRKNLIRLIDAFEKIDNLKLVIVGKTTGLGREGWLYEDILKRPEQLGIENKVIFTGFVPTDELPPLLSGALAFVWPSLWEGFGIPVLEAMACGTPAIVSKVSSLPEIVGSAGLQVDPYSVTEIEQAIRTLCYDQKLRKRKIKEGLKQVKKFSWEKMAKVVLEVFKRMEE